MAMVSEKDSPTEFSVKKEPIGGSSTNYGEDRAKGKAKSNHEYKGLQSDAIQTSGGRN